MKKEHNPANQLFMSPPVVQQAGPDGFTVSIEVNRLCTGRVEWGFSADHLAGIAVPEHGGLVEAGDQYLVIPVALGESVSPGQPVFYRVVAQPLAYANAYELSRGAPVSTSVHQLFLPHERQESITLAVVNDTHGNTELVARLAARVEALAPDLMVWNGDVCSHFNAGDDPAAMVLRPGRDDAIPAGGGWASTRPLLYVPGNHDVRGERARELHAIFVPGPYPGLPYNSAMRIGPLALIGLDAGEDKPDRHPVFAGTAAYEPYRERQAHWLAAQLTRAEIAAAPFKVAFSHIPLRGLPGENDGTLLEGHARYSGQGAKSWLPQLINSHFNAVISGHTHEWRCDQPSTEHPITQIVGGGPFPDRATLIVMEARADRLGIRIEDLEGNILAAETWSAEDPSAPRFDAQGYIS